MPTLPTKMTMRYLDSTRSSFSVRGVIAALCWGLAIIVLSGANCCDPRDPNSSFDRLQFANVPAGEEWGVLIDGTTAIGAVDDRIATGSGPELVLENFQAGPDSAEEVIAVTRHRALELVENAPWTDAEGDLVQIDFDPDIEIPLTIWIVEGPYDDGAVHMLEQVETAEWLWEQERMGIRFGDIEVVDATGHDDPEQLFPFVCLKNGQDQRQELENTIGSHPDRINVYRVGIVNDNQWGADSCALGSGFAALGATTARDILVHEIGHSFGLDHTDDFWFSTSENGYDNVMVSFSSYSSRRFFTEGQVFRAHVDSISVINSLYKTRLNKPVRSCGHTDANESCPALGTRIWPDLPAQRVSGTGLLPAEAGAREPASSQPPPPEKLARRWLLRNCEMGAIDLQERMRTQADAITEILLAAFHRGPSEDLLATAERTVREGFELRRRALGDPEMVGAFRIDFAPTAEISNADYVARELNTVQLGYRMQALRGLLVLRPDRALPLLAREAGDPESPLRHVAARLLERHSGP